MKKERKKVVQSAIWAALIVSLLWIVKAAEILLGTGFTDYGLYPRTFSGLLGIVTAPFIHSGFEHLISNSAPLFVLSFILFASYRFVALRAYIIIFFLTGFWVWVAARPAYHIGASGVVYGLVSFLFFMGIFRRDARSIALALLVTFLYGSLIWGILPVDYKISWESHLLGGIAGILTAILYWKEKLPAKPIDIYKDENEDFGDLPYWKYELEGGLKKPEQPDLKVHYIYTDKDKSDPDSSENINSQQ